MSTKKQYTWTNRMNLVQCQEQVLADVMTTNRYADITGHLGTASIVAVVAAITFESSLSGAVIFATIAAGCLCASRAFDKRASALEAKRLRMQHVLNTRS